jgi:streptogramin lyase
VSSFSDRAVTRIDPRTRKVVARIDMGSDQQAGILATPSAVWVAVYGSGEVVRIDPAVNKVVARIRLGGNPEDAVLFAGSLWVPNENGTLARIDPARGKVLAKVRVGADPDNAIACRGLLWTTALHSNELVAVSPKTNRVAARVPVGLGSVGLACGRSLWTAGYEDGTLTRIDPVARRVTGKRAVGVQARTVLIAAGSVWVGNQGSGTVVRVAGS